MSTALATHDLAVDHELARAADAFEFLLDITPTDTTAVGREFLSGATTEPVFTYRDLEVDPGLLGARLKAIDVERVENSELGHLFRAKLKELQTQLEMLRARNTPGFLPLSIELYGAAGVVLLERAQAILERVPARTGGGGGTVDATEFARLARIEFAHYQAIQPDLGVHVQIRADVSGISVSGHELLVGKATEVESSRVQALLQHEVGTHLVTYVNGSHQPVLLMATGLAGYEETQEGLAVLAEFLVGGLSPRRLRQLAARVVAVDRMVAGDAFVDVHGLLVDLGLSRKGAFTTTMRVFRSGGFTKDVIYLRGFFDLLEHLAGGDKLDLLWLGKLSLEDLPLIGDLYDQGVLIEPRLRPRYLGDPAASERLRRIAESNDVTQLIEEFS
ncbi:MAG: flavohemoglobin expression-modulating QEGLA motif protein [Nocardiaceae bacterium]|nr:flavohemoglobin expression-modulating QEGLA motif protein [Nocardiaceae bacterium]